MMHNSYYFFTNLANATKFKIITLLRNKPLSVNEIAAKINEEQSKVSHNLSKLAHCHILDVKQKGKQRIYSLNKNTVVPILKIVDDHINKNCMRCNCHKDAKNIS